MKTKLLFAFCVLFVCNLAAQSDYSSYLTQSMDELKKGNCEGAQKWYNVYKELSGMSVSSVEVLLSDCKKEYYNVGETMVIGNRKYIVAYVRDNGKHGYAVLDEGWNNIYNNRNEYIKQKAIPTIEELRLIYSNRDIIGLYGKYWSCTCEKCVTGDWSTYKTIDFSTGKEKAEFENDSNNGIILRIHRF